MTIPNVLILTVGGQEQPIINAIENNEPDFIYFLCSKDTQEASSISTVNEKIIPYLDLLSTQYEIIPVKNPDDLGLILNSCKSIHTGIEKRYPQGCRVIANYTGGTKTMSMGLGVFALQYPEWEIQIQTRSRKNLIKVESGDITTKLDLSVFHLQKLEQELSGLETSEEFDSACQRIQWVMKNFTVEQAVNDRLQDLHNKFLSLSAWNRFEYAAAINFGKDSDSLDSDFLERLKILNNLSEALQQSNQQRLKSKKFNGFEMVEDIVLNANRCANQSRFDDAIGRLYRATELLAQTQLLKRYDINTSEIDPSTSCITPSIKTWLDNIKGKKKKYQTSLMNSYYLLSKINDGLGNYFIQHETSLKGFISNRNDSFFAHGYSPITRPIWKLKGKKWVKWIEDGIKVCV